MTEYMGLTWFAGTVEAMLMMDEYFAMVVAKRIPTARVARSVTHQKAFKGVYIRKVRQTDDFNSHQHAKPNTLKAALPNKIRL